MTNAMGRAAPPVAARGTRGYGIVDLTPPPSAAAGGQVSGKNKDHKKAAAVAAIAGRTPVPLWKARNVLLEAVGTESAGFFETHAALSSKRRGRRVGRGDGAAVTNGAGNGCSDGTGGGDAGREGVEHVFSVWLEVCVLRGEGYGRLSLRVDTFR